jgi:hypothetical protein
MKRETQPVCRWPLRSANFRDIVKTAASVTNVHRYLVSLCPAVNRCPAHAGQSCGLFQSDFAHFGTVSNSLSMPR